MCDSRPPVELRHRACSATVSSTFPWGVGTRGGPGLAPVVLSKIEQRLDAVRAVLAGADVTEVAAQLGCIGRRCIGGPDTQRVRPVFEVG